MAPELNNFLQEKHDYFESRQRQIESLVISN